MKKLIYILVLLFLPITAKAYYYDFYQDGIYYSKLSDFRVCVEKGPEYYEKTVVVIPEYVTYDGIDYHVTKIGQSAFSSCENLTNVYMPASITYIDTWAFTECTKLTEIEIPKSVTFLGYASFRDCISLKNIRIGDSVRELGTEAFSGCTALESVSFGDSLKLIGREAFAGCSSLKDIVWGNGLSTIEEDVFSYCSSLSSVTIPSNIKKIEWRAFAMCINLRNLTIEDSKEPLTMETSSVQNSDIFLDVPLETIYVGRELVFYDADSDRAKSPFERMNTIKSVKVGNDVSILGNDLFNGCTSLSELTLGESLETIVEYAFARCTALREVKFPNSLVTIGTAAFYGCHSLESIIIPNSVDKIYSSSFSWCRNLKKVIIEDGENTLLITQNEFKEETPIEYLYLGRNISSSPFKQNEYIKEVTFGNHVTKVLPNMFFNCTSIESIVIPNSIESIGENAFNHFNDESSNLYRFIIQDGESPLVIEKNILSTTRSYNYLYLGRNSTKNSLKNVVSDSVELGSMLTDGRALDRSSFYPSCKIKSNALNPPLMNSFNEVQYNNIKVTIPEGTIGNYCSDDIWKHFFHIEIDEISFKDTKYEVLLNDELQLEPIITPDYATENLLEWSSDDENVATVNSNGLVTTHNVGSCIISVKSQNNKEICATCEIVVKPILVESIALDCTEWTGFKGESFHIRATVLPDNGTDNTVVWSSSDVAVATVDSDGTVTAVGVGEAVITVTAADGSGISATCRVTVNPVLVESISLDPDEWSGVEGDKFSIKAVVMPEDADNKTLEWISDDERVATVDSEGVVSVVKEGTCTIVAKSTDGSDKSAECLITSISGIDDIFVDDKAVFDIYNMQGTLIKSNATRDDFKKLSLGIYIVYQDGYSRKIVIR